MKKRLSFCLSAVIALALLIFALPLRAEAAGMSASFSGNSSIRPGDKVTVTFSLRGVSGLYSVRGTLSYDSNLEYLGSSNLIGGGWIMDGTSTIMLEDSTQSKPFGGGNVFSVTFRVKSGAAPGTKVSASVGSISATDGQSDFYADAASWSATIAAPLSTNANLASLRCADGTLSPAFSASTTSYSVTVPYDVTSLSLSYTTQDSGAKVSVSGNSLGVGSNTVTVTVKAPGGNTKNYVIYATRQQDPNYKPSDNALLDSLSVSGGTLSPAFSPEVNDYVLYVPYEVEHVDLSGVAQDSKAQSVTGGSADLEPGDNLLTVVCVAEDGKTRGEYTVHVYRMPAYEGQLPEIIAPIFADYTAVDEALAKVPHDLSIYTDESAAALQAAVDGVIRDCTTEEQEQVDAMAQAIETALAALEEKPEPEPEPEPTLWEKLLAVGEEKVDVPYVGQVTGPLPLKILAIAAAALLALLAYIIGTLIGRLVGKHRTLRLLREEMEESEAAPVPVIPAADAEKLWGPPAENESAPAGESDAPEAADAPVPLEDETPSEPVIAPAAEPEPAPTEDSPAAESAPLEETSDREIPETPEPSAPESETPEPDDVDDAVRRMSLEDLLDDIKNM